MFERQCNKNQSISINSCITYPCCYYFIIALFKFGVQTQLTTNKNQLTKFTKCLSHVKKEVTHKVIHPESISKMLHIVGILTDHIATSQLDTIKSQVPGDYLILENTRTRITWKLAQNVLPSTYHAPAVNISDFFDNILKFRY